VSVAAEPGRVTTGMAAPARSGERPFGRSMRPSSCALLPEEDVVRLVGDLLHLVGRLRLALGVRRLGPALGVDPLDERRAGQQVAGIIGGTSGCDRDKEPGDIAVRRGDGNALDQSVRVAADGAAVGLGRPRGAFGVLDALAVVADQIGPRFDEDPAEGAVGAGLAFVDLHALRVGNQKLANAIRRKILRDVRLRRCGVGHLRHGQGRCGHGEAYAPGAADTGESVHSRINSEKQVCTGSVHATDAGKLRGWEVLAIGTPMCADGARWVSLRGERRLVGTNAGYGVIPVWPDCATSTRVPTTSGPVSTCLP